MPELIRPDKVDVMEHLGDLAPLNHWGIAFQDLPTVAVDIENPLFGANLQAIYNAIDINMHCTTSGVPRRTAGNPIAVQFRGYEFERPASYQDEHTIDLEFIETTDNAVSELLRAFREFMWSSRRGGRGRPATGDGARLSYNDYTHTTILTRLDNQDNELWIYTMHGCYFRDSDPTGSQLGADDDAVKPTMTLYYDWFTDGPAGAASSASAGG